jgi:hypothetical protein
LQTGLFTQEVGELPLLRGRHARERHSLGCNLPRELARILSR